MKANRRDNSRFAPAFAVSLGVLVLCACVGPPEPPAPAPVAARPTPAAPNVPPTPSDWHDAPITPGDWQWRREGAASIARFGNPQAPPLVTMACNPAAGTITLTRFGTRGAAAPGAILAMETTSLSRRLAAQPAADGATVTLSGRDPLLDAMAYSRGRFAVQVTGQAALYLPSWPEVSRVIEDCRSAGEPQ